ncbi:peptidase family C54-domain-containing protein [Favolaschia claudopus]|uniref:Autophagy-related protein 4 n=1 Tax=Favolaschia claudopus TaxID=2862362 RepID=A0AAV9ZD43_9AGAR
MAQQRKHVSRRPLVNAVRRWWRRLRIARNLYRHPHRHRRIGLHDDIDLEEYIALTGETTTRTAMPPSTGNTSSNGGTGTTKSRIVASSRQSSSSASTSAAGTVKASPTPTPTPSALSSSSPPPTSPTLSTSSSTSSSKLPRFLQSPITINRDRSKSLSIDRPGSAASSSSSSVAHGALSSSTHSTSGRRSATRFLGLGRDKDREKERERQRIREAERREPSAEELLLAMEEEDEIGGERDGEDGDGGDVASPTSSEFSASHQPHPPPPTSYPYGTARPRPRTRSERHFSSSTNSSSSHDATAHSTPVPIPSSSSSSNTHNMQLLAPRSPSRLAGDGALTTRLSGWFAHLAGGSTSDLSIAATISGSLANVGGAAGVLGRSRSSQPSSSSSSHPHSSSSSSHPHSGGGGKKDEKVGSPKTKVGGGGGLLDKAVRYLLDGDAVPDRSAEEIWVCGVRVEGWGVGDEERVAGGASGGHASGGHANDKNAGTETERHAAGVGGEKEKDKRGEKGEKRDTKEKDKEKEKKHHHLHLGHHGHGAKADAGTTTEKKKRSASGRPSTAGGGSASSALASSSPMPPASASAFVTSHPPSSAVSRVHDVDAPSFSAMSPSTFSTSPSTSSYLLDFTTPDPGPWPAAFFALFYAHVWCTYRAGFEPIRDLEGVGALGPPLLGVGYSSPYGLDASTSMSGGGSASGSAAPSTILDVSTTSINTSTTSSSTKKKWWPLGGTKGWTSDTGWGCMLRTSQSLLAVALGRVGEPPLQPTTPPPFPPPNRTAHAHHARLVSWFLDAPAAPFGVHRMALAGKAAGKDVGMWFGPAAAASAVRMLVDGFPACGLGVSVGIDGTMYQTDVFAASHSPLPLHPSSVPSSASGSISSSRSSSSGHGHGLTTKQKERRWGDRPVLLLLGMRLGLDGVNPVYYETIKRLYTFPQSVGIAGGRPSSSYYFIGVQGDGLFYLDPHHSRPSVPLKPFVGEPPLQHGHAHHDHGRRSLSPEAAAYARGGSTSPDSSQHGHGHSFARGGSMSPDSAYGSFASARGGSLSPDFGTSGSGSGRGQTPMTEDELVIVRSPAEHDEHEDKEGACAGRAPAGGRMSDAEEAYWVRAYSAAELQTFHCEKVRKMPLSGLDPSMLLGFVVRDEAEWVDLRRRVKELPRTIFAIQDEPPTWPGVEDDDDMGLESISDPEEVEGEDDGDISTTSHAPSSSVSSPPSSTFSHTHSHHDSKSTIHSASTSSSRSEEVDTEEDPVAPITPLPNARFDLGDGAPAREKGKTVGEVYAELEDEEAGDDEFVDAGGEVDIEDDWIDPVVPSPVPAPAVKKSSKDKDREREKDKDRTKTKSKSKNKSSGSGSSKKTQPVPVPSVHYPFPVSSGEASGPPSPRERERERERMITVSPRATGAAATGAGAGGQRMHTARARDGGRTQSGGVRGILTED